MHTTSTITPIEGAPSLSLGIYDLAELGYVAQEFFISGTARSYRFVSPPNGDGNWIAEPDASAPYTTRIVVVRPLDLARASGTVIVEWLNVSGGGDLAAAWNVAHREMIRNGDVFVAVSAQRAGIEGGGLLGGELGALKSSDPQRYGSLDHPGDAYSFDIFAQVGQLVKQTGSFGLAGSACRTIIATGQSQSAVFLVTYINAIDPIDPVFDGFLIHSRFGSAAHLSGASVIDPEAKATMPEAARFRMDLRVPVLSLITETDLLDSHLLKGYLGARQSDETMLRTWEMAGTAHADRYAVPIALIDSGLLSAEELASAYARTDLMGMEMPFRMNDGPQQHYIAQAAFRWLDRWIGTGDAPPSAPPLEVDGASLRLAADGLALDGVRTPWVDVPTTRLSGFNEQTEGFLVLMGSSEPYDATKLAQLYPGGLDEYLKRFTSSLDEAISAGFILEADRAEILALARASYRSLEHSEGSGSPH